LRTPIALNFDFQYLWPITLPIAVLAAQIHIAEELHFYVLEARASTGRASAVAAVEAEFGCGVTALLRHGRGGEYFSHCIPCAHITCGIRSGSFTDGGLVYKYDITQMIST
jgi:hypothetical protein